MHTWLVCHLLRKICQNKNNLDLEKYPKEHFCFAGEANPIQQSSLETHHKMKHIYGYLTEIHSKHSM